MYSSLMRPRYVESSWFRTAARASAAVLFVCWLVLVVAELMRSRFEVPSAQGFYQGFALALIFCGYAIGLRYELSGGVLAIIGTLAFVVVNQLTISDLPDMATAWFAVPGVLYLLAWYSERHTASHVR